MSLSLTQCDCHLDPFIVARREVGIGDIKSNIIDVEKGQFVEM